MTETNTPSVVLYKCQGTHSELGQSQGEQAAHLIRDARELLLNSDEFKLLKPSFIPSNLFLTIAQFGMWIKYSKHIKQFYPRQFERLMGIARGAGVRHDFVMLLQSFEVELNKVTYETGGACSAVGVRGTRAKDGEPIIIKNFDYPEKFQPMYITRLDAPSGRFRVLNVTAAPLPGNHDGINEHGLCISYNYGYGQDKPLVNVPITIAVQEALETCRTTAEAVDFLLRCKRCGGALLMICDPGGDLRTLELSNTRAAERLPQHSVLINTNHYLTGDLAAIDVPADAVYCGNVVAELLGQNCRESSEVRYTRALELLAEHDTIDDNALLSIFKDHGPDNTPGNNTICRHSDYFETTCSVIFYPARRKLKVAYGQPCTAEFAEFSI